MLEFRVKDYEHFKKCWPLIRDGMLKGFDGGKELLLILQRPRRNSLTNRKLHAMITDIHNQAVISFVRKIVLSEYTFDECKALLIKWFDEELKGIGEPLARPGKYVIDPINGDKVYLRPSTTEMSQKECCKFIEFLYATGSNHGVKWSEKAKNIYSEYIN